jgi:hypothetical protein
MSEETEQIYDYRERAAQHVAAGMIAKAGLPISVRGDGTATYTGKLDVMTYVSNVGPEMLATPEFAYVLVSERTGDSQLAEIVALSCEGGLGESLGEHLRLRVQMQLAVAGGDYEAAAEFRDRIKNCLH